MPSDYHCFAQYYDALMEDVDYGELADFYLNKAAKYCPQGQILLDLGCGTGRLLSRLEGHGLDLIGVDGSPEMLQEARNRCEEDTLLLCQDLTRLDLYGTVDIEIACLDVFNSLRTLSALRKAIERAALFLAPGGILLADFNTPYKFQTTLNGNTFIYDTESVYCVWQSTYQEKTRLCSFDLDFFVRQPNGSYFREYEQLSERAHSDAEIREAFSRAGLTVLETWSDLSGTPVDEHSERIYYLAKKVNV